MINLSVISMAVSAIFLLVGGLAIYKSWKKKNDNLLKYFAIFFLGYGVMHSLLAVGALFSVSNSFLAGICYVIAHFFLFTTTAFFLRLPLRTLFPKFEKPVFYVVLIGALLSTAMIIKEIPLPFFDNGITNWNVGENAMKAAITFSGITLLALVIFFIIAAVKSTEKIYKVRSIVFALGIFVFLTGGPLHNAATNNFQYLLADVLTPVATLILLFGVYLPYLKNKNKIEEAIEVKDEVNHEAEIKVNFRI
ncbi:MAG: hypothetical protein KAI57_04260 [Candidatus Pacebacteria bacterium]|nr:hypothetical protein [Candidatus Paceibacterota bacterium]